MNKIKKILISLVSFVLILALIWIFWGDKIWPSNNEANNLIENNQENIVNSSGEVREVRGVDGSDIVIGQGELEIIVYEDLSDFYSVKFNKTLNTIKENFSDQVKIAFRPYANKMFSLSYPTNSFVECAKEQNKFFEARELVLQKVEQDILNEDDFLIYGEELRLNNETLKLCLLNDKYISEIEEFSKEAEGFGVYGSPAIFVGRQLIVGARDFENVVNGGGEELLGMKNIINEKLGNLENNDNMVFCTMDAKMCPDGSFVGRDGDNNCEFFPCPNE
ncbi:MAG TPA: thioredoxin domain-containing protein [bacterium]|nr:thioredoxin domain-containing protein [bacterium]